MGESREQRETPFRVALQPLLERRPRRQPVCTCRTSLFCSRTVRLRRQLSVFSSPRMATVLSWTFWRRCWRNGEWRVAASKCVVVDSLGRHVDRDRGGAIKLHVMTSSLGRTATSSATPLFPLASIFHPLLPLTNDSVTGFTIGIIAFSFITHNVLR